MKRFSLALVFVVLGSVGLFAQQTAVTLMPLTQSAQFLNRVTFQIVLTAPLIEVEAVAYTPAGGDTHPSTPACHTLRANLAAAISRNPSGYALIFADHLVTSSNVTTAGALTGSGVTLDTPATDGALFSAVAAIWSNVAGYISNP